MESSRKNKIETLYWVILVVAALLAILLVFSFLDVGIRSQDSRLEGTGMTVEERLQRLQELRASSTVTPPNREERIERLERLRGGD